MYSSSPGPLVLLRHPLSSSGKSPRPISESVISSIFCTVRIFHIMGMHTMSVVIGTVSFLGSFPLVIGSGISISC